MGQAPILLKLSFPARLARMLPFGAAFAFTYYNRIFRNLFPVQNCATSFGALMRCDNRDFIQTRIFHFGLWEPDVTAVFVEVLKEGDTVVDVGANIGYFSLLAAKLVGPTGSVIAIEASPRIATLLKENINRNSSENIRIENLAVSDQLGQLTIYEAPDSNIGKTTTLESRGFKRGGVIEAAPLETILEPTEAQRLNFIKIDVEGGEAPILNNIIDKIALYPNLTHILVEASAHEAPQIWTALFDRLVGLDFAAKSIPNKYDYKDYLKWRAPELPKNINSLPISQSDILFERQLVTSEN